MLERKNNWEGIHAKELGRDLKGIIWGRDRRGIGKVLGRHSRRASEGIGKALESNREGVRKHREGVGKASGRHRKASGRHREGSGKASGRHRKASGRHQENRKTPTNKA